MEYLEKVRLKDGRECILRNGVKNDGKAVLDIFVLVHEQTDFLLSYPDENTKTAEQEGDYLQAKSDSPNAIEILAVVDGVITGLAGIDGRSTRQKLRHRADLGISIDRSYWGLGIGTALTKACIECAQKAGYEQLELTVVSENETAISIYKKAGFVEFGRNPRGFKSQIKGYQEIVYMRKELILVSGLKGWKHERQRACLGRDQHRTYYPR